MAGGRRGEVKLPDKSMRSISRIDILFFCGLVLYSLFFFGGVRQVPFHPDESTYLYMSSDFERFFSQPGDLFWVPGDHSDQQRYRLVDAPLIRYILGAGRSLAGLPSLPADWDWSKSWDQNRVAGALPDPKLLTVGRTTISVFLPLSLILIYLIGRISQHPLAGLFSAFLLGSNALVLLHGRRAMAEGILLFGITLFIFCLYYSDKNLWLPAVSAALAFNAKHSAIALFPVGLLAVSMLPTPAGGKFRKFVRNPFLFSITFLIIILALNPVLWKNPIGAARAMIAARSDLLDRQVSFARQVAPQQVMETPPQRLAVLLTHLFVSPPIFAEAGNYLANTAESERIYMSLPSNNLFRGLWGGGILLFFTLMGLVEGLQTIRKNDGIQRRWMMLLLLSTLCFVAVYLAAVPFTWQRYVMPLIPFTSIWAGLGLERFLSVFIQRFSR